MPPVPDSGVTCGFARATQQTQRPVIPPSAWGVRPAHRSATVVRRRSPHFEARVGHEPVQEVAPVAPSGYGPVSEEGRVAAAAVGDRVVAAVGRGVDGDDVGAVGEVGTAGDRQAVVVVVQDGEPAGFRGDVEAMRGGV